MSKPFKLNSAFKPSGDQPDAIRRLEEGLGGRAGASDVIGRDRLREDIHHRQRHCGLAAANDGACAQ